MKLLTSSIVSLFAAVALANPPAAAPTAAPTAAAPAATATVTETKTADATTVDCSKADLTTEQKAECKKTHKAHGTKKK
jgi:hypothetical protein